MSSRKRGRKPKQQQQQQQQLTFEAVHDADAPTTSGTGSTLPGGGLSPAKVRFASPGGVGSTGSPVQRGGGIALRSSTARPSTLGRMSTPSRKPTKRQQTLDVSMGRDEVKKVAKKQAPAETDVDDELTPDKNNSATETHRQAGPPPPRSSFMRATRGSRRAIVVDSDSETPVEVDGAISDSDGEGPLKQETPRAIQTKRATSTPDDGDSSRNSSSDKDADDGENEDEDADNTRSSQSLPNHAAAEDDLDDEPLVTPRSSMPRRKGRQVITLDDDDDDDDEDENEEQEDEDVQTPAKRRRVTKTRTALIRSGSVSSEIGTAPAKSRGKAASKKRGSPPPASTARSTRSAVRKGHRTEKEKRMELLRRRRAGEKDLTMEDLATSEDEDDGALYDTDEEYQALDVFDDESEHEEEAPAKEKSKKKSKKSKKSKEKAKQQSARQSSVLDDQDANSEDENFIDDEDDTMGVPDEALHLIPIEFTRASRKPLKDHFKDAVEWLVHRKINPGFDRDNEVYVTAWRRLSDEVTGLANSKFISSVWRPDFHKALKARPYIEQQEIGAGHLGTEFESCQACGRSGHPATWSIQFKGKPYDPKSLDEVESDSEDEDDVDRDYDGSLIPPEDKEFLVGQTCNANAETAHSLTHWRPSLRDWVDARLEAEGWMEAGRIVEREKMKPRRRERLADQIVERWHDGDIVKNLFMDFKRTIESAREKDTTKVRRGGGRY